MSYSRSRKPMTKTTALIRLVLQTVLFSGFAIYAAVNGNPWPWHVFALFGFWTLLLIYAVFFKP